jgi:DNA-binding response OmpR family regulator
MSKILVVEDDLAVSALLRTILTRAGHDVVLAHTGADGLACCDDHTPDLVTLDVSLPGLDGLEVLRQLRGRAWSSPVLVLTAERDTRDRALEAGADAYLQKPFDHVDLLSCVNALLAAGF